MNKEEAIVIIEGLIPLYQTNKKEADKYKKCSDQYNAEIKQLMLKAGLSEVTSGTVKAVCSKSYREDFIEEALIEKIKEHNLKGIIKKKEYVDMDALENAIYNGQINAAELACCQTRKEVVTLRLLKANN